MESVKKYSDIEFHQILKAFVFSRKDDLPDPEIWRIRFDKMFITFDSGKYQWGKIGHAKAALKNYLAGHSGSHRIGTYVSTKNMDLIVKDLMKSGRLEFVKL